MNLQAFAATLRDRIAQMAPPEDTESILELLFNAYTAVTGLDNETIREMDEMLYPVCTLCRDHEKAGFEEGIKVGLRLAQEINL